MPAVGQGQERDGGQRGPRQPHGHTGGVRRPLPEGEGAERVAQDEVAVEGHQADEQHGHLVGQDEEETRRPAGPAVTPAVVAQNVGASEVPVRRAHHDEVDSHEEVGHAQVGHEHAGRLGAVSPVDAQPVAHAAHVAHHRQHGEHIHEETVIVGA